MNLSKLEVPILSSPSPPLQRKIKMWKRLIIGLTTGLMLLGCSGKVVRTVAPDTVDEKRINLEANKSYKQVLAESKLSTFLILEVLIR